jgi:hypothetical protein
VLRHDRLSLLAPLLFNARSLLLRIERLHLRFNISLILFLLTLCLLGALLVLGSGSTLLVTLVSLVAPRITVTVLLPAAGVPIITAATSPRVSTVPITRAATPVTAAVTTFPISLVLFSLFFLTLALPISLTLLLTLAFPTTPPVPTFAIT